jgi:hypothetical protein
VCPARGPAGVAVLATVGFLRVASLLVAVVLTAGVLWLAGEEHRRNCLASGHTSCSVVPWDNGRSVEQPISQRRGRLTPTGCELLEGLNDQAVSEDEVKPLPPECR